jgi:hypothetical protein
MAGFNPPGGIPPYIPANGSYYADGCAPPSLGNPGGMPPPCICYIIFIAFCIFYGFIICLIISGLLRTALSYGFESVIYFNIGLLLII